MPPTIGEEEGTGTGDKEEDHQPEEMCLHQDTETPPRHSVSTVKKRDTMCETAPRRGSNPIMKGTTGKPTLLTYKKKGNKTTKCKMPRNQTPWHQFMLNWSTCPLEIRYVWQKKWESLRIFPWPN